MNTLGIGMYGFKGGMWNLTKDGCLIAATTILPANCWLSHMKAYETDGYNSIEITYEKADPRRKFSKHKGGVGAGCGEFRGASNHHLSSTPMLSGKSSFPLELSFSVGEKIRIVGNCIGKGFGGNQKRHKYQRGPLTHGSKNHRAPGSIGAGTTPGRVYPGKRMAGQHGFRKVALISEIVHVSSSFSTVSVKGSLPGKHLNLLKVFKIQS